jgi:hypothetical protein
MIMWYQSQNKKPIFKIRLRFFLSMLALRTTLLLALLSTVVSGCQRAAVPHFAAPPAAEAAMAKPEMVFLSFKAASDGTKPATISLLKSTVVTGTFKDHPEPESFAPAYLVVSQLNAAQQPISSAVIEHPLLKSVEAFDDNQKPGRQTVSLQEAEFFVRMMLTPQTASIRVEEFVNSKKTGTTNFPLPSRP